MGWKQNTLHLCYDKFGNVLHPVVVHYLCSKRNNRYLFQCQIMIVCRMLLAIKYGLKIKTENTFYNYGQYISKNFP